MAIDHNILQNKYKTLLALADNINNISNNTLFMGGLCCSSNFYVSGTSNILGSITIGSNLTTQNFYVKNNFIIQTNLTSNNYITNNLSINSNLYVSNISILNNTIINSNLFISSNCIINNITTNSLFISSNSILNNIISNNLSVSGLSLFNNMSNTNIYVSSNTLINKNTTIVNSLYVSNTATINSNVSQLSILYNNGSSKFNNSTTITSNLYISGNANINQLVIGGNTTVLSNLNVIGTTTLISPNISTIILNKLPEYQTNIEAANAGIPLWGYYRTGDILKIRTDIISPTLRLSGNSVITLVKGNSYIDPGVIVTDNLNETIVPYIIAINYTSINYLSNPIPLSSSTLISALNTYLVGNQIITYTATDSYLNSVSITRTVTIVLDMTSPSIILNGTALMKIPINTTYIESGITITDNQTLPLTTNILGTVNTSLIGKYLLSYRATDASGNVSNSVTRTVYVLNTDTKSSYSFDNPSLTYLYLAGNYNSLISTQFWTIECWLYLTSLSSNGCMIIDFREKPYISNTGKFAILINTNGYPGIYHGTLNQYFYLSNTAAIIPLNTWTHLACQLNGMTIDFYINGLYVDKISSGVNYNSSSLNNFNQITLGMSNDLATNNSSYHMKGSLSQVKISLGNLYKMAFIPNNDLTPSVADLSNTLFFLGDNYTDIISNTILSYPTSLAPIISTRQYYINLNPTTITSNNLLFNLQVTNLPITNTSWIDSTGNYQFIVNSTANNFNSITKVQNNNGWKRTRNVGWVMNTTSLSTFKNQLWINGLTLEQWIYIDYNFIPSSNTSNSMLLVGQSSLFSSNDYGFCLSQGNYPYLTYPYNILSFATNTLVQNQGTGAGAINIDNLRGKWNHLAVSIASSTTTSTSRLLNIYVNSALVITLNNTQWTNWPNPNLSSNNFCIGCANNGTIQSEALNKIHFGNTRMYNRMLYIDEIINNYNNELPLYIYPTSDIYFIKSVNIIPQTIITNYDVTLGWLSQTIDLNKLRTANQWSIEIWAYPISWGTGSCWLFDLSVDTNYLSFGVSTSINNITPSITSDGNGRPFIYNSNDTVSQMKMKATPIIPLYNWSHIVYQKNSQTELEMFVNGISTGTITITASNWIFPNFCSSGINNIILGGDASQLSSQTNHWQGRISQAKINLYRKYISSFTPAFDLSLNDNGIFLLQDNFINNAIGKSMSNTNVIIPSYTIPTLIINGNSPTQAFINTPYIDSGVSLNYYLRKTPINIITNGLDNITTSNVNSFKINYSFIDDRYNIVYIKRLVNVVANLIPPTIVLNGSSNIYLTLNSPYIEQGCVVTSVTGEIITPIITGSVDITNPGIYSISYTATDSSYNTTTIIRTVTIFTSTVQIGTKINSINSLIVGRNFVDYVIYNGSIYLFTVDGPTTNITNIPIFISSDLVNWTSIDYFTNIVDPYIPQRTGFTIQYIDTAFSFKNSLYLQKCWEGGTITFLLAKSIDGINWTQCLNSNSTFTLNISNRTFTWNPMKGGTNSRFFTTDNFIIITTDTTVVLPSGYTSLGFAYSSDGINWITSYLNHNYNAINNWNVRSVIYGNNNYIFCVQNHATGSYRPAYIFTTTDFINYNSYLMPIGLPISILPSMTTIYYQNGIYLVLPYESVTQYGYYYSSDGINWSIKTLPSNYNLNYSNYTGWTVANKFVIWLTNTTSYLNSVCLYSYDGLTWAVDSNITAMINSISNSGPRIRTNYYSTTICIGLRTTISAYPILIIN